jgi:hypothetical protein
MLCSFVQVKKQVKQRWMTIRYTGYYPYVRPVLGSVIRVGNFSTESPCYFLLNNINIYTNYSFGSNLFKE